jgi:hypothetical protein
MLSGIGLITVVRMATKPELRRAIFEWLAERFPIEDLLDELVLDADVVPDADDDGSEGAGEQDEAESEPAQKTGGTPNSRRRVARARGDTNGQHGRKPPNRGTRA